MEHDERERRDRPDDDMQATSSEPSEPAFEPPSAEPDEAPTEPIEPVEPVATVEPPAAEEAAPAEIESWPSQEATAPVDASTGSDPDWRSEPEAAAWPTEPPAAGSAGEETWPTEPPAMGAEPILEPGATPVDEPMLEPPPSEVEAYPASVEAPAMAAETGAHAVPAAESATGESTQCPRCGTENRPGLAFCRNCGQRLVAAGVSTTVERPGTPEGTMACPRCGTHNRAGVAFCQNCGANLRGAAPGYVPPAVAEEGEVEVEIGRRGAVLGPVVLLIGLIGFVTAYLLPFAYGSGSLFDRAFGAGGYGAAFWTAYPDGAGLADQAYFGLAAAAPILGLLLIALAVAGFARATPGMVQAVGLVVALVWSVGLILLFVVVELAANWGGDIVGLLRDLTPAGIIFFLAGLIVVIGTLTRFGRS
ncbi:MAG TPA: zinc-ribbon domain-containing protein [Candidatus Limnocylindria bacterium]